MDRRERINDPEEAIRIAIESRLAGLWSALPGIVSAVDLGKQTVSVQPAIKGEVFAPDGTAEQVNLPLLVDVPIVFPRAGGFAITLPVAAGDECLVVFSSRCIDAWWQSGGVQAQAEWRMGDLSDGFAIPGPTSQPRKLANVQANALELRDSARSTYISLSASGIEIKGDIKHTGNITSNNKNIGSTHSHSQGPDSAGNTQQNISGVL